MLIPYNLILLNHEINNCTRHTRTSDGELWVWGRTFGFAALIWFIISSFQGITMNKHAKLFHRKKNARDLHCISSFLAIIFMIIHFYFLYISEPWKSIFLLRRRAHLPMEIFLFKIWLGIIFGTIMITVSILSVFARNPNVMKIIGFKRFRWIHWILVGLTSILVYHILYLNTELWIMGLIVR